MSNRRSSPCIVNAASALLYVTERAQRRAQQNNGPSRVDTPGKLSCGLSSFLGRIAKLFQCHDTLLRSSVSLDVVYAGELRNSLTSTWARLQAVHMYYSQLAGRSMNQ